MPETERFTNIVFGSGTGDKIVAWTLAEEANEVLRHLARLWGFTVRLETSDETGRLESVCEVRN